MSVRVVARIRPLLEKELDKDVIVRAANNGESKTSNVVKIPNPKNESEEFSFTFNSVYDQETTQEALFTAEVNPTVRSLFQGLDVTIFAYGVTGTGKTHTMRGGMKLADRGVIPRLLSNVFRRAKKMAKDTKDTKDETTVDVRLAYYEIYNDKVFDLLEAPEKRTASGLPLREGKDGKTVVVGLSERACGDVRDFERLYVEANANRVTAATKLNAHSSRSHAILRVTLTQTTADTVLVSTASAIDLAGSEDNRRTDNGRERLVESAAINKSLFVLSQCIEAISRGDRRVPYRESKMTRILSLGQNNGVTVMILNLAPLRSYHLDTLSSLNVSSRAKRIEVREIENEVVFKNQPPKSASAASGALQRQPLRPLSNAHNPAKGVARDAPGPGPGPGPEKKGPAKAFDVYPDRSKPSAARWLLQAPSVVPANSSQPRRSGSTKRRSDSPDGVHPHRPAKMTRPAQHAQPRPVYPSGTAPQAMSAKQIEDMVEKKVSEILAQRAADAESASAVTQASAHVDVSHVEAQQIHISEEVQRRLDALERRIEDGEGGDGLRLLFKAKEAKEHGDDVAALRFYEKALPFFPTQTRLLAKIERLRAKQALKRVGEGAEDTSASQGGHRPTVSKAERTKGRDHDADDEEYHDGGDTDAADDDDDDDNSFVDQASRARARKNQKPGGAKTNKRAAVALAPPAPPEPHGPGPATPRTRRLLDIVNSGDVALIRGLHGFGAKKAQDLVDQLGGPVESLAQLRLVPGMGSKTIERAYEGLVVGRDFA